MAIPKKISAPSPSCTDWASLLWRSVPLSALPQATLQEHHRDPDAVLAFVKDPERVRAKLRELPAAALAVLDRLIVAGGALDAKLLVSETLLILERSAPDVPVDDCAAAGVIALTEAGLITTAASSAHRRDKAYALVAEAAPVVAAAAYGALLNAEEQPEVPPSRYSDPDTREVLVFAATSAHVALRANQNQAANLTDLKRLAKNKGVDRDTLDKWLQLAAVGDLLLTRAGRFVPNLAALLDAARRRTWRALKTPVTALPEGVWISLSALTNDHDYQDFAWRYPRTSIPAQWPSPDAAVGVFEALRAGAVFVFDGPQGVFVSRAAASNVPLVGDGHVTSSFEVMLGKEASLELIVKIALAAELKRYDQVLVFGLTPATVAAGLAAGLTPAEIEAALDAVGKQPMPDNVRAMVRDWCAQVRLAALTRGWILQTDPDTAQRLAKSLADHLLGQPAPGMLVLDLALERQKISQVLERAGVRPTAGSDLGSDADPKLDLGRLGRLIRSVADNPNEGWWGDDRSAPFELKTMLPLVPEPDPVLVTKWRDAVADSFDDPNNHYRGPVAVGRVAVQPQRLGLANPNAPAPPAPKQTPYEARQIVEQALVAGTSLALYYNGHGGPGRLQGRVTRIKGQPGRELVLIEEDGTLEGRALRFGEIVGAVVLAATDA